MARPLLTDALRRRFAELGPQDDGDDAKVVVAAHFSLPGTGWDWYITAYDEDGDIPQCFCLVRGRALELGWVGLAELERLRSPRGMAVERDETWRECSLAVLRRRLAAPSRPPAGYWRRGGGLVDGGGGGGRPGAGRRRVRAVVRGGDRTVSERPGDDGGLHRSRVADALALWRIGERNVTRPALEPNWRADYEAAVTAALGSLQRHTTMVELVAAYFALGGDAWLDALCRPPSGHILNVGDVEDAAYWRRAQQLIAAAADGCGEERH